MVGEVGRAEGALAFPFASVDILTWLSTILRRASFALFPLAILSAGCRQIDARLEIQEGNRSYQQQRYDEALKHYLAAQSMDNRFADLDRVIGYSYIGLYEPENAQPANQKNAASAIESLKRYLAARPADEAARDTLAAFYLSADRIADAIQFFADHLRQNPKDLDAAKSIATLHAKQGDFEGAMHWYREITVLDARNPEAFYILGVVLYEKVSKNPDADEAVNLRAIEQGKTALARALQLRSDYFEALVYTNLLFREQAERALDETRQQALLDQADVFRNRAVALSQARKTAPGKQS